MDEVREEPVGQPPEVRTTAPAETVAAGVIAEKPGFDIKEFIGSERVTRFLYYLCGGVFITLLFRKLQYSTASICCGDLDGYYHIRWSRILWENLRQGHFRPPAFTWLPLTSLDAAGYVDHHYLFHLLQIPFTWFFSLPTAAKFSAVFFASLAVFGCYWLVMRYRLNYPLLWLMALLACSAPFLYRMNMAKAPPLAIIFIVIGIDLLFKGKYVWLAPLMFVFVWAYDLFPTLFLAMVIWTAIIGWSEERFEWRPFVFVTAGMLAGLVINPYFPKNIVLLFSHAAMKLKSGDFAVAVGNEWYPYSSWELIGNCLVAFVSMLVGYVTVGRSGRVNGRRPIFFMLFSTALMIGAFRWRRFVEYWPPFAVLFAAFSLQMIFDEAKSRVKAKEEFLRDLEPLLDKPRGGSHFRPELIWQNIYLGAAVFTGVFLFVVVMVQVRGYHSKFLHINFDGVADDIHDSAKPDQYQKGMEWVWANVPPGQTIFNTDWDDFPKLFYYDTTHAYVSGLDPNYLYDKNPELSKLYENITLGKVEDPGPIIRDKFGAHYVFSDKEGVHDDFYGNAMDSGWFDNVYEDDDCVVLKFRDVKGPAPNDVKDDNSDGPDDNTNDDDGGDNDNGDDGGSKGNTPSTLPLPK